MQRGPSAQHQISNLPPEQQHAAFWDGRVSTGAGVDMAGGADGGAGRLASRVALRTGLATTILVEGDSDDAAARSDASLGTGSASTRTASESEQGSNACAPASAWRARELAAAAGGGEIDGAVRTASARRLAMSPAAPPMCL